MTAFAVLFGCCISLFDVVLGSGIDASEADMETAAKAVKAALETWSKLSRNARACDLYR